MELFYSKEIKRAADSGASCSTIVLRGAEADHCARVMRHKEGDSIFIIDGEGGLYNCKITRIVLPKRGDAIVECKVLEKSQGVGQRNYHLVMAVCPTKNMDRYEWFVEKATELGVDSIVPLISEHSIRTNVKKERLEALVLAATKQSLKSCLPVVEDAVSVTDFLNSDLGEDVLKLIAHCENGNKKTIRERLKEFAIDEKEYKGTHLNNMEGVGGLKVVLMIGPEGDFSAWEIELALQKGFLPVTLGPSRLRVETAAVAGVSEIYFSSL